MWCKLVGIFLLRCLLWNTECIATQIPTVTFNNGVKIPILGLGTWKADKNEVGQAVKYAIDAGYRHFDCAYIYKNEKEIGQAIADKIGEGAVKREDLFITSKLWNSFHRPEAVEDAIRRTLKDLRLEYVDLYLIHWPMGFKEEENSREPSEYDYVDTWKAMEAVYKKGLARSIGISNFNKKQIERLLENATVVPVTNQVECHPYLNQKKLLEFCKSKDISITAYSPLGSANVPPGQQNVTKLLDNPKIIEIGEKYHKTPAQVILRYQTQRGVIVIPKSVNKNRIIENFNIFDFELSTEDMNVINSLDFHGRITLIADVAKHKYYPFYDEY